MKKLLSLGISLMIVAGAFAQTNVERGSTANYTVNVNNSIDAASFSWTIDPAIGTIGSITSGVRTSTAPVTFSGGIGNTGYIRVHAVSTGTLACPGPEQARQYTIVAPGSITVTATFPTPLSNICPYDATTNATGGDIAAVSVNFLNSGVPVNVSSFTYAIDGVAAAPVTVSPAASSATFNPATQLSVAGAHAITITSITVSAGSTYAYPLADGTIPSITQTVDAAPVLSTW